MGMLTFARMTFHQIAGGAGSIGTLGHCPKWVGRCKLPILQHNNIILKATSLEIQAEVGCVYPFGSLVGNYTFPPLG